jgi:hypothetical protein
MRQVRIILALLATAALLLVGCTSRSSTRPAPVAAPAAFPTTRPLTAASTPTSSQPSPRSPDPTARSTPSRDPATPFPGIWDVRTWQQARALQDAVDNGHQPWRCGPDTLVSLYAQQVLHVAQPVVHRIDAVTFSVTRPGQGLIATVTVTQPIRQGTCGIWVITRVIPSATATCAVSPTAGPAGSRTTLSCRGFADSEAVTVTFGAETLAVARATASGGVAASFAVPDGFAGSHYPGRRDVLQAKGQRSGKVASATFTVTG